MNKLWKVIRYEYLRHVLRKGFLIAVLSVPFWIILMLGIVFLLIRLETSSDPVGYVDQSGILSNPISLPEPGFPERLVTMLPFDFEEQAQAALDEGEIEGYYVVAADYVESRKVRYVFHKDSNSAATAQFRDYLRLNLLAQQPEAIRERVITGADLKIVTIGDDSEAQGAGVILKLLAPMFSGIALMVAIFTSSGYLMQAVVDEKENRTMEIMITSISPEQMMGGKVIGLIAVGLTQILVWLIFGMSGLLIFVDNFDFLSGLNLNLGNLWLTFIVILPAFVLVSALMAAIGATVTEAREGQQVTGLITLPIMLPFILFGAIFNNPNGILAVILSLFPLTAPMTIIMRAGFTVIPTWQIVLSVTLLVISAVGALWLAGHAFRLGMLRYGQRVRLREIFAFTRRTKETES